MGIRLAAAAVTVTVVLSAASCSWIFVDSPPSHQPPAGTPVYCTTSRAMPVLDVIIAVPNALVALIGVAIVADGDDGTENDEIADAIGTGFIISGGIPAALYGASAYSGFKKTRKCREMQRRVYQQPAPRPGPQPNPWDVPPGGGSP